MTDAHTTADARDQPSDTSFDPVALFDAGDVSTETVEVEVDAEHFERFDGIVGRVVVGVTNADGEVLLLENTDPDVCHDWVLPHGPVEDEDWIESAVDWTDGLTGVTPELGDAVHVRRNDVTDGDRRTTVYHVLLPGRPLDDGTVEGDVRYDCDDAWRAEWRDSAPDELDGIERDDVERFLA